MGEVEDGSLFDTDMCHAWHFYAAVASTSAGAEVLACEVLVLGIGHTAAWLLQISHALMRDPIDGGAVMQALADCGIKVGPASRGLERVVQVCAKADPMGVVYGRRSAMLDDSDIHATCQQGLLSAGWWRA
jgi:cyanuric acid amidohydrolase